MDSLLRSDPRPAGNTLSIVLLNKKKDLAVRIFYYFLLIRYHFLHSFGIVLYVYESDCNGLLNLSLINYQMLRTYIEELYWN